MGNPVAYKRPKKFTFPAAVHRSILQFSPLFFHIRGSKKRTKQKTKKSPIKSGIVQLAIRGGGSMFYYCSIFNPFYFIAGEVGRGVSYQRFQNVDDNGNVFAFEQSINHWTQHTKFDPIIEHIILVNQSVNDTARIDQLIMLLRRTVLISHYRYCFGHFKQVFEAGSRFTDF